MLTEDQITNDRVLVEETAGVIEEKSRFYFLGSDPTRLKIIFLLNLHGELCVTDLSRILDISISAVSHQLSLMERSGLVQKIKMGQMACYSLSQSKSASALLPN